MEERGFTLMELLAVLSVAAILLTIAVPGYAFLVNTGKLATATNDLMSAVQLARSEAVKRRVRVTVCKSRGTAIACDTAANWQQGWIVFVDGATRGAVDAGDSVLWVAAGFDSQIEIDTSNFSNYISYRSDGVSQGQNNLATGSISLCLAGDRREIIVNSTGRPRLRRDTC